MRINGVHRHIFKLSSGHIDSALSHEKELSDGLGYRSLAAHVGSGQDVECVLVGKIKIVPDYISCCFTGMLSQELDVVDSLRIHGFFAAAGFMNLRFAKECALSRHVLHIFSPTDIIDKLRHQIGYVSHGDHSVFIQHTSKVFDRLTKQPVCYLVHVVGDGLCGIICFRHLHHAHHGKGTENRRYKLIPSAQRTLSLDLIESVVFIPVSRGLDVVFCRDLINEMPDHCRFGKGSAVYGNKAYSAGFKSLV